MRKFLLLAAPVVANNALNKVIQMIKDVKATAQKDGQEEATQYAAYSTWCSNTKDEKTADIEKNNGEIENFKAKVLAEHAREEEAITVIGEQNEMIAAEEENQSNLKSTRQSERDAYNAMDQEMADSIYAADQAIKVLSSVDEKVQAVSFIQKALEHTSKKPEIHSLLAEAVHAADNPFYASERKSDTVISLLEQLLKDFRDEKSGRDKAELESVSAFKIALTASQQAKAAAEDMKAEKEVVRDTAAKDKAAAEKGLKAEEADLKANTDFLNTTNKNCEVAANDNAMRVQARKDEMTALDKAISVLESKKAQAGAGHTNTFAQVSFLQLKKNNNDAQDRAINYLRQRGTTLHSQMLVQLANLAMADPFAKIINMIKDLVGRLEAEALAEADKKAICDQNMAKNAAELKDATEKLNKAQANLEATTGQLGEYKAEVKNAKEEIANLEATMREADKEYAETTKTNEQIISESKGALEAIDEAVAILKDFYKDQPSLMQTKQEPKEYQNKGAYTGGNVGGIFEMMEVLSANISTTVSDTESSQASSTKAYNELTTQSKTAHAEKSQLVNQREIEIANLAGEKQTLEEDVASFTEDVGSLTKMKASIDAECSVKGVSFEERNAKRQEEIDSLKEALTILSEM